MALSRGRVLLRCHSRGMHDVNHEAYTPEEHQDDGCCSQSIGTATYNQRRCGPRVPSEHREQQEEAYECHDTAKAQHDKRRQRKHGGNPLQGLSGQDRRSSRLPASVQRRTTCAPAAPGVKAARIGCVPAMVRPYCLQAECRLRACRRRGRLQIETCRLRPWQG